MNKLFFKQFIKIFEFLNFLYIFGEANMKQR